MPVLMGSEGEQFEVSPGSGDLTYAAAPFEISDAFSFGSAFYGGRPISYARVFAEQPWVATAVMRLLTWAIRVPLKTYRMLDDGGRERLTPEQSELARGLAFPWPRGCQADLVMALLGPLCVHGNALVDVEEGRGGRLRFNPIDWRMIRPQRENLANPWSEILSWEVFREGMAFQTYSVDRVMHLRWWSPLGNLGVSPLQQLRATLASETASIEWAVNNLEQSWRPNGVVELSEAALALQPDDRFKLFERAKKELRETYSGQKNAGKLPVIPPGLKWTKAEQTTAVEAELINQRMVNRNEVAAVYQLPPPMIGQLEHARTMTGLSTLREIAYTDALAPPLVMIEQLVNAHLVQDLLQLPDVFVEFDLGAVLRGNRLSEIKALREGVGMGLYTPNEARGALNLPKSEIPSADEIWMPTNNLSPIGAAGPGDAEN